MEKYAIVKKSQDVNVFKATVYLCDTSKSSLVLSLPDATHVDRRSVSIARITPNPQTLYVAAFAGQTINGKSGLLVLSNDPLHIIAANGNWYKF